MFEVTFHDKKTKIQVKNSKKLQLNAGFDSHMPKSVV